jgi:hypothetical protein
VPAFRLACLAYLSIALPASTLGLLWPSMRLSFHQPVGALGILLVFGVTASVISSAATGRILSHVPTGSVVAFGATLPAVALAMEALAPSLARVGSLLSVGPVAGRVDDGGGAVHLGEPVGSQGCRPAS